MCPESITKTSPCIINEHPLTPYFYTVKLGFTGVYIYIFFFFFFFFFFLHQNIDCGYSLEPTINVLSKNKNNI